MPIHRVRAILATGVVVILSAIGLAISYGDSLKSPNLGGDDLAVVGTPIVEGRLTPRMLRTIFTPGMHIDFYPIRDLSYRLDRFLWGGSIEYGFRFDQLVLHIGTGALLLWVLLLFGVPEIGAALVALLWTTHPIHAVNLMWISARKDVLALALGMLSMVLLLQALRRSSSRFSVLSALAFLLSVFSKSSLVPLPWAFALASLMGVSGTRTRAAKVFLILALPISLGSAILTWWFYSAVNSMDVSREYLFRLSSAAAAMGRYALGVIDPKYNTPNLIDWAWIDSNRSFIPYGAVAGGGFVGMVIYAAVRRSRTLLVCLGAALLAYLPTSGLVFPHAHYYSVTYIVPAFTVLTIGVGFALRRYSDKLWLVLPGILVGAHSLMGSMSEGVVWQSPAAVANKWLEINPQSIAAKSEYLSTILGSSDAGNPIIRGVVSRMEAELDEICLAPVQTLPRAAYNCEVVLLRRLGQSRGEKKRALFDRLDLLYSSYPDIGYGRFVRAHFTLTTAEPDLSRVAEWIDSHRWAFNSQQRSTRWAGLCALGRTDEARSYLEWILASEVHNREMIADFLKSDGGPKLLTMVEQCGWKP